MKKKAAKAAKPRARKVAAKTPKRGGSWRLDELPVHLQVELRDRSEQAERGEDLEDFDEAMADADRMTEEMLAIVREPRRPAQ